ncbi:Protein of unknown function [Thermobacillus xylanilyticus]|uniref:Uncharacterized protein n=1 Tax=Thermobacillus xylanilyticus TaxID=76633 RepID=A0ABM8V993_THEXY|nr:Protein of unknown function [Thermobacillus xylanilyticus]
MRTDYTSDSDLKGTANS